MKKYAFPLAALLLAACNSGEEITTTQTDEPVARILEYTPAPGQFINEEARSGGAFDNVDTPEKACRYAAARFAENNWVSLGGWGGYLVAAFAEPVPNTGGYDLYVKGNAMNTSSEPGVVWVMQDANGNGDPNDEIPLTGSAKTNLFDWIRYINPWGLVDSIQENFLALDQETLKPVFIPADERYKEAVAFFHKLYAEGIMDPEFITQDGSMSDAKWKTQMYLW